MTTKWSEGRMTHLSLSLNWLWLWWVLLKRYFDLGLHVWPLHVLQLSHQYSTCCESDHSNDHSPPFWTIDWTPELRDALILLGGKSFCLFETWSASKRTRPSRITRLKWLDLKLGRQNQFGRFSRHLLFAALCPLSLWPDNYLHPLFLQQRCFDLALLHLLD